MHFLKRWLKKPEWKNLRSVKPVSRVFGLDRGTPVDRYYIEKFLCENKHCIKGTVLEIAESTYSRKFGSDVEKFEVLHVSSSNPKATIIGDLTNPGTLPENKADCFICTQTLNFIFDFQQAVKGMHRLLKKDGVLLATVAGISQISRYDMDRWGDYWRFTVLSAHKIFSQEFGEKNVVVDFYGNVLSSVAFLEGIATEELTTEELEYKDRDYQLLITIKAVKK